MRVIAGTARSIPLITPKGDKTRPTIDKHKETLFNCLADMLYDSVFLDLYSGSGGIGIEALSRGAKVSYFAENDNDAIRCIKENLKKTRLEERGRIVKRDVKDAIRLSMLETADIIFMDPPFLTHAETEIIPLIMEHNLLKEDGIIVVECNEDAGFDFLERLNLEIYKEKNYKSCRHVFIKVKENAI